MIFFNLSLKNIFIYIRFIYAFKLLKTTFMIFLDLLIDINLDKFMAII